MPQAVALYQEDGHIRSRRIDGSLLRAATTTAAARPDCVRGDALARRPRGGHGDGRGGHARAAAGAHAGRRH